MSGVELSGSTRGRPRSEAARARILSATAELLVEQGYDQLTMVGIAVRAEVGKQTLYRWWSSKALVVADCVLEDVIPFEPVIVATDGDAVQAIRSWLTQSHQQFSRPDRAALFRALIAATAADDGARAKLRSRFITPLANALDQVLSAGAAAGQIRPNVVDDAVSDLLLGAMIFSLLTRTQPQESWVDGVMRTILGGITHDHRSLPIASE